MSHAFSYVLMHVVFSTKDRFPMLDAPIRDEVEKYICGVNRNLKAETVAINSVADHLHLLAHIPAALSVSDFVSKVKSNSSRFIHESWPERSKFQWQQGYGAFSVSRSAAPEVARYIENQEEHHRKKTFQEEFVEFLRRHDMAFDETHMWS